LRVLTDNDTGVPTEIEKFPFHYVGAECSSTSIQKAHICWKSSRWYFYNPAGQVKNNTKQAKQRNAGFDGFLQLERTSFYLSQTWTSIINQFFH
jgi:hypothetical protein